MRSRSFSSRLCGVTSRQIYNSITDKHVSSPAPAVVHVQSLFGWYTLIRGSVIDTMAKQRYAAKLEADTRRIEANIKYREALTKEADRRHLLMLTPDEHMELSSVVCMRRGLVRTSCRTRTRFVSLRERSKPGSLAFPELIVMNPGNKSKHQSSQKYHHVP
jgi:hypothetical protein